jgi:hypothetical protein
LNSFEWKVKIKNLFIKGFTKKRGQKMSWNLMPRTVAESISFVLITGAPSMSRLSVFFCAGRG